MYHDRNIALQVLKRESIFADLLIINSSETFTHYVKKLPTRFIHDLLVDAQCPIMIAPPKNKPIKKIILLYDGEASSVHGIKMVSYLLPQLKNIDTEVISVISITLTLDLRDNKFIKKFMKTHYPKAKYIVLNGFAKEKL